MSKTCRFIEDRINCYCVATAAGVATVVGGVATAASAGYSAYSASQAGKGQGGSALYGSKPVVPNFPPYDPTQGAQDYQTALPFLNDVSNRETQHNAVLRNKLLPGASAINKTEGANLSAMAHGEISQDQVDQINRTIAEKAGEGFDPTSPGSFAGGASTTVSQFARDIGGTSHQLVNESLSAAPTWENMAQSFLYKPEDALAGALDFLKMRYQANTDQYTAQLNQNKALASPDPSVVGLHNDLLTQQAIQQLSGTGAGGGYASSIKSLLAGVNSIGSGYGQLKGTISTPSIGGAGSYEGMMGGNTVYRGTAV